MPICANDKNTKFYDVDEIKDDSLMCKYFTL